MSFSLSFNPFWSFVDLVGQQLDDTYYLFTIQNESPYALLPIYQDQDGTTPWSDPIQFLASGTLPVNMYWDDDQVYRLEIRHGNTQTDDSPLIWSLDNYIPNNNSSAGGISNSTENQITNPQFSDVDFVVAQGMTVTTNGPVEIAPGWYVVTTGSGTLTINQIQFIGSDQIGGNPAYGISIQNVGFTSVSLQQKFNHNGALWAGGFVGSSLTAKSASGSTTLSAALTYSGGSSPLTTSIITLNLNNGWQTATNAVELVASTNTNTPDIAYTTYSLTWAGNVTVSMTNIQLVGQDVKNELYPYQQTTNEQQLNGEFWYYKPKLEFKPIKSYLTAWDFPLNPAQVGESIGANANLSYYTWDQTIVFQSTASRIATSRSANGSIVFTASGGEVQMAMIQYLKSPVAREIFTNNASVNVRLSASNTIAGTVSIWYTENANLPDIKPGMSNAGTSLVTTLDANGHPSAVVSGWVEWPRSSLGNAQFSATTTQADSRFNGWAALPASTTNAIKYMAIVVGTASMADTHTISFQSVSLVPGDIPTIPAPQTVDDVIRECQYYYEKSYDNGTTPGAFPNGVGSIQKPQTALIVSGGSSPGTYLYPQDFQLSFNSIKINTSPIVTFYSTETGNYGKVRSDVYYDGSVAAGSGSDNAIVDDGSGGSFWIRSDISSKGVNYILQNANALTHGTGTTTTFPISGYIKFQYTVDSRLGVVTF